MKVIKTIQGKPKSGKALNKFIESYVEDGDHGARINGKLSYDGIKSPTEYYAWTKGGAHVVEKFDEIKKVEIIKY